MKMVGQPYPIWDTVISRQVTNKINRQRRKTLNSV